MAGIPDHLYKRLRETLLECGPFDSNQHLKTIFANASLAPWRHQVPEASSPIERVEAIIHSLMNKRNSGLQANALVLFLQALNDRNDPDDLCYQELRQLTAELSNFLQGSSPSTAQSTNVQQDTTHTTAGLVEHPEPAGPIRDGVFICYSHTDKKYLQELQLHLAYYIRTSDMRVWDDTKILPGSDWRLEIEQALQSTKVALLLISADLLASEFATANEIPPLLTAAKQEGVAICPVILRPCAFKDTTLAQFQSFNAPSEPLAGMAKGKREALWNKIAEFVWYTMKK